METIVKFGMYGVLVSIALWIITNVWVMTGRWSMELFCFILVFGVVSIVVLFIGVLRERLVEKREEEQIDYRDY